MYVNGHLYIGLKQIQNHDNYDSYIVIDGNRSKHLAIKLILGVSISGVNFDDQN